MKEKVGELVIKPEGTFLGDKELPVRGIFIQLPDSSLISLWDVMEVFMTAKYGRDWKKNL